MVAVTNYQKQTLFGKNNAQNDKWTRILGLICTNRQKNREQICHLDEQFWCQTNIKCR